MNAERVTAESGGPAYACGQCGREFTWNDREHYTVVQEQAEWAHEDAEKCCKEAGEHELDTPHGA